MIKLTAENFEREVSAEPMVVVWKTAGSVAGTQLARAAEEKGLRCGVVDIEGEMELAMQYGMLESPVVSVFDGGEIIAKGKDLDVTEGM